jgi:hypothetical protein
LDWESLSPLFRGNGDALGEMNVLGDKALSQAQTLLHDAGGTLVDLSQDPNKRRRVENPPDDNLASAGQGSNIAGAGQNSDPNAKIPSGDIKEDEIHAFVDGLHAKPSCDTWSSTHLKVNCVLWIWHLLTSALPGSCSFVL